jgi:hypothetical protein
MEAARLTPERTPHLPGVGVGQDTEQSSGVLHRRSMCSTLHALRPQFFLSVLPL